MAILRIASLLLASTPFLVGQPTIDALSRTYRVQSKHGTGTIFSIDVDGREYWVTAAHILTGAKGKPFGRIAEKTIDLKMLNPGGAGLEWFPVQFTVIQPTDDVDVVALAPKSPVLGALTTVSPTASSSGLTIGGACEFLGFALGGGWRAKMREGSFWMPYVKRCTVSGQDFDSRMFILDGISNKGFSGGPVILGTGVNLKFVAVISGYYLEPTEVIRGNAVELSPDIPKDTVRVNSGFIIAYDISHAIDAIKKNPIGPKRGAE